MADPPLMGFEWNEAGQCPEEGLVTIMATDRCGELRPIGTAFILNRKDESADCVTAAHVFGEVRRLQNPHPRHSPSTPAEFLPLPGPLKIDLGSIFAVSAEGTRIEVCEIYQAVVDNRTDIAIFSIRLQANAERPYFNHCFTPSGDLPSVGDLVCIYGFAGMASEASIDAGPADWQVKMTRRPLLRVGKVTQHFPAGSRLCRGPCFETSVPVYSGMSGGPAVLFGSTGAIRPFGVVCSDPDPDDERKQDRSIRGSSIIAALPFEINETGRTAPKVQAHDHAVMAVKESDHSGPD